MGLIINVFEAPPVHKQRLDTYIFYNIYTIDEHIYKFNPR